MLVGDAKCNAICVNSQFIAVDFSARSSTLNPLEMAKQYATWRQLLYLGAPQACPHAASPPCRRGKPAPV